MFVVPVSAGELLLKNGDRLAGELERFEADNLVWLSDSFGHLTLAKNEVASLTSDRVFKLEGHAEPCQLLSLSEGMLEYHCADQTLEHVPLLTVDYLLPYESYENGAHSYEGKIHLSGETERGDKDKREWEIDLELGYSRGDYRHQIALEYENTRKDGDRAEQKYEVAYGLDWFFSPRWFWYNQLELSSDEKKDIDSRADFDSGVGYQFLDNDKVSLAVESGFGYVQENFDEPDSFDPDFDDSDDRINWRLAADYRYRLPLEAELFHRSEFLQSLRESGDWQFESETGLSIPLGFGLFSEFKLEYDVDNQPQEDKARENSKLEVGVGYEW